MTYDEIYEQFLHTGFIDPTRPSPPRAVTYGATSGLAATQIPQRRLQRLWTRTILRIRKLGSIGLIVTGAVASAVTGLLLAGAFNGVGIIPSASLTTLPPGSTLPSSSALNGALPKNLPIPQLPKSGLVLSGINGVPGSNSSGSSGIKIPKVGAPGGSLPTGVPSLPTVGKSGSGAKTTTPLHLLNSFSSAGIPTLPISDLPSLPLTGLSGSGLPSLSSGIPSLGSLTGCYSSPMVPGLTALTLKGTGKVVVNSSAGNVSISIGTKGVKVCKS